MVLVNKKILVGGLAMLIVGIVLSVNISATMPVGQTGMTEEEIIDLMIAQQETQDYNTLSGILIGIGFLLVLISFGARRKKDSAKKVEKKTTERFKS
jgi:ABC-type Fe3+ transport system permease subunit